MIEPIPYSATRLAAAMVFGVYLSAQAAFRLDIRPAGGRNPPLHLASYVCVLNQPVKTERMLYKRWKSFCDDKTKAEAERTELGNHYYQQRDWPSADDFQE